MNEVNKEIEEWFLDLEDSTLDKIKKTYNQSLKDVQAKAKELQDEIDKLSLNADPNDEIRQSQIKSKVYQLDYQKSLEKQISNLMDVANDKNYKTVRAYLYNVYHHGFLTEQYRLMNNGLNITMPINQKLLVKAVNMAYDDIPLSTRIYDNVNKAKQNIISEISRGLSIGMSNQDMARNLQNSMRVSMRKAFQIAQNEGARVRQGAIKDSMVEAKKKGADIVKQWSATLDGKTRPVHRELDGQYAEIDEKFKYSGGEVNAPKEFGIASEDINCRCTLLSVPRWDMTKTHWQLDNTNKTLYKVENYQDWYDNVFQVNIKLQPLETSLKDYQDKLANITNNSYSGIWYNQTVSVSDYSSYKNKVQSKKDWYNDEIAKLGNSNPQLVAKYQGYLKDLDEFEKLGKEYEKYLNNIDDIKKQISSITPKKYVENTSSSPFNTDAYTQERKDKANWFKDRNANTRADKAYRDKTGDVWQNASQDERDAIYEYTHSYSKFNEPLRGFEYGTSKYVGVGKIDLDQVGVNYGGYKVGEVHKKIDDMTSIIDKCSYDEDMWLQRGVGYDGMDKFFGINASDFSKSESELSSLLVGTTPTEHGFMSATPVKGKGFSGNLILNIYAPKGTKMMYAEPFSHYGGGNKLKWDGKTQQSSFGTEMEMILQRETKFRVTKVEKNGSGWFIDMEVIGQENK